MTVLLVDDEEDQLFVREMLFAQAGFVVLKAATEAEALRLARENQPTCAVVDLCLPREEDGLELIRELKQLDPSLPVAVLTGKRLRSLQSSPEWKLIDLVVEKGSSAAQLLAKVKGLRRR